LFPNWGKKLYLDVVSSLVMAELVSVHDLQATVVDFFKNQAGDYLKNTTLTPDSLVQSYTSLDPLISALAIASVFASAHWFLGLVTRNYSQVGKYG
jgi:hypothetical protein